MKVVSRPLSYVCMGHVEEENMKNLEVKQEPLDVDDNQTSSTVCIPQLSRSISTASVTRKEEGSPPMKRSRLDCDDSKCVTHKIVSDT